MSDTSSNKKSSFTNRNTVIIGILLAVVIGAATFLLSATFGTNNQGKTNTPKTPDVTFKNWLKPEKEIKVGENRYISACQIINYEDVEEIFGTLPDNAYISENYIDSTPSKSASDPRSRCDYAGVLNISFTQFIDDSLHEPKISDLLYRSDVSKAKKALASFETATKSSDNQNAKKILAKMQESFNLYNKNSSYEKADRIPKSTFDGLITPSDDDSYEFNLLSNGATYTFTIGKGLKKGQKLSDTESVKKLEQLQKIYTLAVSRTNDETLPQSPAPTIISGKTDMNGTTSILEPCSILSKKSFKKITTLNDNQPIFRTSILAGIDSIKNEVEKTSGKKYPSNNCERTAASRKNKTGSRVSISLKLEHGDSKNAGIEKIKAVKLLPIQKTDKKLKTKADFAMVRNASTKLASYIFVNGPYIGIVDYNFSGDIDGSFVFKSAPEKEVVKAINVLSDALKKGLATVAQ